MPLYSSVQGQRPNLGPEQPFMIGTYHDEYQFIELTDTPVLDYPAGIQDGDSVFCIISTYADITPPSGWTLVTSQLASQALGSTSLKISVYKDTYATADGSTSTWTLAFATNFSAQVVALAGTWNVVTSTTSQSSASQVDFLHPVSTVTATADGQVALTGSVCDYSFAYGTPYGSYYVADFLRQISPSGELPDMRLGISYKVMNNGDGLAGGHVHGSHSNHAGAEATLLLEAA